MGIGPLGEDVEYPSSYAPEILYAIDRPKSSARDGYDHWRCYEVSWLDYCNLPCCAILELAVPSSSPFIVESKSLKLYLGSFSLERFRDANEVQQKVRHDLEKLLSCNLLRCTLNSTDDMRALSVSCPEGRSIDGERTNFQLPEDVTPDVLATTKIEVSEHQVYSEVFRSLCPVTGQPDFATVSICYSGREICEKSLLKYLSSFRKHQGFHEACAERIYADLMYLGLSKLAVHCYFTRRGGIEINPCRASFSPELPVPFPRMSRQ